MQRPASNGPATRTLTAAGPAWLLAAALGVFTTWLFWPGLMSFDSLYQYRQVLGELPVRNYHPPVMVYAWRGLHAVFGPGGLLLLHQALYWSGIALIATGLTRSPWVRAAIVAVIGMLPPLWIHSAVAWNDAGVTAAWLFTCGCAIQLAGAGPRWLAAPALLALAYGTWAKEHALLAALPLFLCLADAWLAPRPGDPRGRFRRVSALAVATFTAVALLGYTLSHAGVERMTKWTTVAVWDLAAVSIAEQRLLLPRSALNHPGETDRQALERLAGSFRPEVNGTLVNAADLFPRNGNEGELRAAWLRLPLDYPLPYLQHRVRVLLGLLGLGRAPINLPYHDRLDANEYGLALRQEGQPVLQAARDAIAAASGTVLFRPWVYLAVLILAGALFVARGNPATFATRFPLYLCASGLLYLAPLVIAAPATDLRYTLWMIACAAIAVCCAGTAGIRKASD